MIASSSAAEPGLRAQLRRPYPVLALAAALVVGLASCAQSDAPQDGPDAAAVVTGAESGVSDADDATVDGLGSDVVIPTELGDVDLQVLAYEVPEALDGSGSQELGALLDELALEPDQVRVIIAFDPHGSIAIGRWQLPQRSASDISAAWQAAAIDGWRPVALGGESALTGRGPDGKRAWAVARDGVLLYVTANDESLAGEAIAATR